MLVGMRCDKNHPAKPSHDFRERERLLEAKSYHLGARVTSIVMQGVNGPTIDLRKTFLPIDDSDLQSDFTVP